MAQFVELHAGEHTFLINDETILSVGKSPTRGRAMINRDGQNPLIVDETYEYVRDLLQGKVVRPSSAYEKEW